MVNFGKEIENEKKWNEKNLGPCMNVFLNFDPYTTLDLFHPKQWLQKRSNIKEIETWKVARIGYETAKWLKNDQCWKRTQFYGLRTKWMNVKSEIPTILHFVLSKKGNNRKNESILEKNKVSVKASKMI